ncbi:MAG: glycosyltransferase involved in cell wall biosynthesis [Parvicella sp.]|jgi:glycosyltransferase involved in cell wall biosynthesis
MRILQVHNSYLNLTGDDAVVAEEHRLLRKKGHIVEQYLRSNTEFEKGGLTKKIQVGLSLKYSKKSEIELREHIQIFRPDIVHVHNIFPLITPAVFFACAQEKVPVLQTLHNYRLLCVNTLFYRDGSICELCTEKSRKQGVYNRCYNGSLLQSRIMTNAIEHHFSIGTWTNKVDSFICLSGFAKTKFIAGGIPSEKLFVKSNFVEAPTIKVRYENFFLYVGKLEEQKGLNDFLHVAKRLPEVKFILAGFCQAPEVFMEFDNIEYHGQLPRQEIMHLMSRCKAVLFLSKMYEGMPMTILEAFAHKKPVIARSIGAMNEMIDHGQNGLHFNHLSDLKDSIDLLSSLELCKKMGEVAGKMFNQKYSEEKSYRDLFEIYTSSIERKKSEFSAI